MDPLIILAGLAGVPLVLAVVLRVSALYLFVSVVTGGLMVQYLSEDVSLSLATFLKHQDTQLIVHLGLLFLPVALTLILLRKTLKSSRFMIELVPLAASVALLTALALPQLPKNIQDSIMTIPYGRSLHQSEELVVGAAVLLNLGTMWLFNRSAGEHSRKHH